MNWLKSKRSGGLNGRLQRAVRDTVKLLKLIVMDFLPGILQMTFAIIIALTQNLYIGCLLLLVVLVGLYIVIRQIRSQKGIRISLLKASEENDANIVELLSGIEAVRVANEECKQIIRINNVNEDLRLKEMHHHIKMMFFDSLKNANIILGNLIILLIGIYLVISGTISPGEIVTFNLLFNNVVIPLQNIHRFIDEAHEASLRTDDLREIMSEPLDKSYLTDNSIMITKKCCPHVIEVKNLSYGYKENTIFRNVSISLEKGKYYGIIGNTGCGKSTLLKLLMRLMPVNDGKIIFLGEDINTVSRKELSNKIIFMPQTPYIFSASIRENLLFGCQHGGSDEILWWALEKVCLKDYVAGLEKKLDYSINEMGNNLSGGQKQRIALARVFIQIMQKEDDHIVILDESTSALDVDTERIIINNLLELKKQNETIIAIAHRFCTLEKTDEIIEMKNTSTYNIISYTELINRRT
ncbi:ABC transporter ATP-binding protein/permease [Bacteroides fragilis]|nr:ABC transporter ATP-binding protein/permease [Bacteroides fragilis]